MERFANGRFTEGSFMQASVGLNPHHYVVHAGIYLYRFIDITRSPATIAADGPWWFEFEHYCSIKAFSERNGYSLGYAARLMAAILYEWSEVNSVVRARVVTGPLMAWKGKGKQVTAKGYDTRDVAVRHGLVTGWPESADQGRASSKMTPTQGTLEVLQLFIPGLGKPHNKFSSFMKFEGFEPIVNSSPRT